jgi:hypothetical protein
MIYMFESNPLTNIPPIVFSSPPYCKILSLNKTSEIIIELDYENKNLPNVLLTTTFETLRSDDIDSMKFE